MRTGKTALYEDLKHQILTLERAPDEALDEVGLGERYGISRTPVRDVLRQLAGEGYIEHRENRGARVIPMNHATMRDFFSVAPVIYEAVARLAVQNFRPEQLVALQACQARFRTAVGARDHVQMVVENTLFHSLIGEMSGSMFLSPSYSKLLIDHARIGHTFFRPTTPQMEQELHESCDQHDQMIEAIRVGDEAGMVALIYQHWGLCRSNMEMFIAPRELPSTALKKAAV
ncbi:GntR family transcriptional regulator (plasmid) [Paracoccus methylovorus]|uniref:GntR family transcriptional regulator n=1 Tax=Paracoccus methylovorus TaxID=2812658 RepID=A0ABX7JU84_9RHOB|nr:GntR family transcriptional regulator [Paracoccus methylovorus]QRZ16182.1 GntR family transcriptional regulator [Paracoccus methylovorus]